MKTIMTLIAGLVIPCTAVLQAREADRNYLISGNNHSAPWTTQSVLNTRKLPARVFTANHRLYWKYRAPVIQSAEQLDAGTGRTSPQVVVVEPIGIRRNPVSDIARFGGIQFQSTARTTPAWNKWLFPRTIPSSRPHGRTNDHDAPLVVIALLEF